MTLRALPAASPHVAPRAHATAADASRALRAPLLSGGRSNRWRDRWRPCSQATARADFQSGGPMNAF